MSRRKESDRELLVLIQRIYARSNGRYGSPRVHKALEKQGVFVGRKRVERLMREANLKGRVVRVTFRQVGRKRFNNKAINLLLDREKPTGINQVWVADVTYLKVRGQWQYLATVMDQYSRRIIGWSLSATRTTQLTRDALGYALKKRNYPRGIIFHTDRGIEFTGFMFQSLLSQYGFKHSVNRPGCCTDNAFMESFYHSLKGELIRGSVFKCVAQLRRALQAYINKFYNTVRLHSGINYVSPIEYEQCVA